MTPRFLIARLILLSTLCLALSPLVAAQASSGDAARVAKLELQVADAKSSADNSWMLTSSALVLMMTGPGLALFYGGLVRKKNVLGTMMQSFAMMAIVTVLWALFGYSLAFAPGNSLFGSLQHAFMRGVGAAPDPDYSGTIPQQTFMIYQLMFAVITPALITGAFAERIKFSAMTLFMVAVVDSGLQPHGAHGLGQRRSPQCRAGRAFSDSGFRRWNRGARYFGRLGPGLRALPRPSCRIFERTHAAAQRRAQLYRRLHVVGGMVRL